MSSSSSSALQACMQVCNTHACSLNMASSHLGVYGFCTLTLPSLENGQTNTHTLESIIQFFKPIVPVILLN